MENLQKIIQILNQKKLDFKNKTISYSIPECWLEGDGNSIIEVNPFEHYISIIQDIIDKKYLSKGSYSYNMFIRATLSFEHKFYINIKNFDKNEEKELFNNLGTFLKAIAFLPYLVNLGINKIHILPINSIGLDGKKGTLGSPYAIRNHYKLDENLGENILADLTLEQQYKAFVEACHLCNIKLIQEFVFRIASIDSDLTLTNPNWFYWLKNTIKMAEGDGSGYSSPKFSDKQLTKIKDQVEKNDFSNLTPPDEKYRNQFTKTPYKVARVETKIIGLLENLPKPKKSNEVKIAPAFADWPPDDNQPAWSDVTYFKLFDQKDFNYIAYNTVRMYDYRLAQSKYKQQDLWDYLSDIIPYYIKEFDIDGAMIDMGHSLPEELLEDIIKRAKKEKSDFIFWEESFNLTAEAAKTYSATLGYAIFDSHIPAKLAELVKRFEENNIPIKFFGTSENHNTPRTFMRINDINYLKMIYIIYHFLPSEKYIHSGFEICEKNPVNTGLQFSDTQIQEFPAEKLSLFSDVTLNWSNNNIISYIKNVNNLFELDIERKVAIIHLHNNLYKILITTSKSNYELIYNHSSETIEIENDKEIVFSNNIELFENKILLNSFGFCVIKE